MVVRVAALRRIAFLARTHWAVAVVLALYAASAFVVPTLTDVPVNDDWFYAHSVENLLQQHVLTSGQVTTTLIFQVVWGALFASLFGMTYGVLRLSTVVAVFLSGWALYGLCRELAIARARSALGVALYLFNPLSFVLGFTFMSDSHFTALLIPATLLYVRGMRAGSRDRWLVLVASAVSALAFLVRHHGILIPLAVVSHLALSRRLRWDIDSLSLLGRVAAIPVVTAGMYFLWLRFAHGVPGGQSSFLKDVLSAGVPSTVLLGWLLAFFESMYAGFFVLPLAAAAIPATVYLIRSTPPPGRRLFGVWTVVMLVPAVISVWLRLLMPYIPSFLTRAGLGPNDLLVARPGLVHRHALIWPTVTCALSAVVLGLALCRKIGTGEAPRHAGARLVLVIALWQAAGVVLPSFARIGWQVDGVPSPSLDRYLLPLLPLVVCLALWALHDVRLVAPLAWLTTGVFAIFAIAGTRDSLLLHRATWDLARRANQLGVANTRLDGGATWDASHLSEYSRTGSVPLRTPEYEYSTGNPDSLLTPTPPWWIWAWAPATDSSYVIVGERLIGFDVVDQIEYSSWLHRRPMPLYLVRRPGAPEPR